MRKFLLWALGIILILLGCVVIYESQETFSIVIATLLWIAGLTVCMFADPKKYNETLDMQKMVDVEGSIKKIYNDMKNIDTPLGKPWLCKIFSITDKVIVYGPNESGDFIYLQRSMGMLCLAGSSNIGLLKPDEEDAYRLAAVGESRDDQTESFYTSVSIAGLLEEMTNLYELYAKAGAAPDAKAAQAVFTDGSEAQGHLYTFTEDFKLTGQKFFLQDLDGEIIYDIEGTYPLKTLRIRAHGAEEILFRVTKRLLHLLPHYDFYEGEDKKIGSFSKKIDFTHDSFSMKLPEGTLTMRSVAATIGANYIVKIDSKQIGTIGEDYNLTISNLVFDNMVLEVFDDKYLLLMTALAIMSAREMSRDEDDNKFVGRDN